MKKRKLNIKKTRIVVISSVIGLLAFAGSFYYYLLVQYPIGIVQPFEYDQSYSITFFNAEDGIEFVQPTGTKIKIPKNALIDARGNIVKGEVELRFREFHNSMEIFLSGIPMQMGEEREKYFSSAGMFELRAYQNQEELSLKQNEIIDVQLANFLDTVNGNYKLFELENDEMWGEGSSFNIVPNSERDSALASLKNKPVSPLSPLPDSNEFIFEIKSNYEIMPHLRAWDGVKWKLISSQGDLSPRDAMRVGWSSIQINKLKRRRYEIVFSSEKRGVDGRLISFRTSFEAMPLLKGASLREAMAEYEKDLKVYEERLAKIQEEEERYKLQSQLLNEFSINGFGIYNCDKLLDVPYYANIEMRFDFEDELNPLINEVTLYMLLEDENGVLSFRSHDWGNLPTFNTSVALVAVLPDGNVAYVSSARLKEILNNNKNAPFIELKTIRISYEEFLEQNTSINQGARPSFI